MSERPDDNEPVMFGYSSSSNVTFHGKDESGYTKGEWRAMSESDQADALRDFLNELVDVYVEDGDR